MSRRAAEIAPFFVMDIQRRALQLEAEGADVIHLEIGQPDFGAPEPVLTKARQAMDSRRLGYTDTSGVPALREAISRWYAERFGARVGPERIMVTTGASAALLVLLAGLADPADEFLIPDPSYPCNRNFVRLFEGRTRFVPVSAQTQFQPTRASVESQWNDRTRGLILASPANPTGTCIPADELARIHAFVRSRSGVLIVDEIYQGLVYDHPASTALGLGEDLFVINSFSKYFGMTGWRLGWLVSPVECMPPLERIAQNAYICPPALPQVAALAAFSESSLEICEARRREYAGRRDQVIESLERIGFTIPAVPTGAFYVYADCSRFGRPASELARDILEKTGVALTPGLDFGTIEAERYLRLAYVQRRERLAEALDRIGRFLGKPG